MAGDHTFGRLIRTSYPILPAIVDAIAAGEVDPAACYLLAHGVPSGPDSTIVNVEWRPDAGDVLVTYWTPGP